MTTAYLNRVATAVPPHDVHAVFLAFAEGQLRQDRRDALVFARMAKKGGIAHRYSWLEPGDGRHRLDLRGFYRKGDFPSTAERMRLFEEYAPVLAVQAVEALDLGADRARITHVLITCCTGFVAPGLDLQIVERCGLRLDAERTVIGFMGCYAAINGLKTARHIVRSEPEARVLLVNLELCTLHLKESDAIEQILSFMLFADGAAASVISAEPVGFALDRFHAVLAPSTQDLITWGIRDQGFDMVLSGKVPAAIQAALGPAAVGILDGAGIGDIDLWAVHPGGRTVLDAVEKVLELPEQALAFSRDVLRRFGNMSSATVMFVLRDMLAAATPGQRGCAMAFGPGLVAETMLFHAAG